MDGKFCQNQGLPSPTIKNVRVSNFSKHSNLDDLDISFPIFPSRTNLKLCNIYLTTKLVKKFTTNFDSSKPSGHDCIPVVFLKNSEPKLSHILTELFNMCLEESCAPDC